MSAVDEKKRAAEAAPCGRVSPASDADGPLGAGMHREGDATPTQDGRQEGPTWVDTTVAAHVAEDMHGPRYGVDWIWHDDVIGLLHPQTAVDALRAEVERLEGRLDDERLTGAVFAASEFAERQRAERAEAELASYKADTEKLREILGDSPGAKLVIELEVLRTKLAAIDAAAQGEIDERG